MLKHLGRNKPLALFLAFYSIFMVLNLKPFYLDSDEGSHAMTALFYHNLINDLIANPTLNPSSIYDYAKAYYVHYPKFSFTYGPIYTLLGGLVFLLTSPSILVLRLITLIMSIASLIVLYAGLRNWFNKNVSTITILLIATSHIFFDNALKVMLDLPAFFLFTLSFYYFTKSFNTKSIKHFFLCGLFGAISIMTKEAALIYVLGLFIIYLINIKKLGLKQLASAAVGLVLTLSPYLLFVYYAGGLDVLISALGRPAWYGELNQDPQWYSLESWLFLFNALTSSYSLLFTIMFIISLIAVAFTKDNKSRLILALTIITYLFITFSVHKITRLLVFGLIYFSLIVSKGFNNLFTMSRRSAKTLSLFFITLVLLVQMPLSFSVINTPSSEVADDLVNLCTGNCSILVASETAAVYSSAIMYESMLRDYNVSLRFLRPTIFNSKTAPEVINEEKINYVIVIGTIEFIEQQPDYFKNVQYIVNRYPLVKTYYSDVVGRVAIYRIGLNQSKQPPYCSEALAINTSFCTNFSNPASALV